MYPTSPNNNTPVAPNSSEPISNDSPPPAPAPTSGTPLDTQPANPPLYPASPAPDLSASAIPPSSSFSAPTPPPIPTDLPLGGGLSSTSSPPDTPLGVGGSTPPAVEPASFPTSLAAENLNPIPSAPATEGLGLMNEPQPPQPSTSWSISTPDSTAGVNTSELGTTPVAENSIMDSQSPMNTPVGLPPTELPQSPTDEGTTFPAPSPVPTESVPTDLSHLVGGTTEVPVVPPDLTQEVAPTPASETNVVSGNKGFPKILIPVGLLLLLAVAGGSAYFILGIGKPVEPTASLPAEQPPVTTPKVIIPPSMPTVPATTSANFGQLSPSASPSGGDSSSSALDLLRARSSR